MAGYKDGEKLWLDRLRIMDDFNRDNSSRCNWLQRNNGKSNHYAVLKPGVHTRARHGLTGMRINNWQTITQLWQKYADDETALINLEDLMDRTLNEIDKWPRLEDAGNTLIGAMITEVREVFALPADGPQWLYVELVGEWDEQKAVTLSE